MMKRTFWTFLYAIIGLTAFAQNPIVPGYFADPSIRFMDGKYYLSITSDGYDLHNGEPFIWVSDNLVDWDIAYLNINDRFFWAPSMVKGANGKYYMVHQQGVDYLAYLMEADSPLGPWQEVMQVKDFDVELFKDPKSGNIMGIGSWKKIMVFDNDVNSPTYMRKIVNEMPLKGDLTDFTEGPYIFYKDGLYYLMWAGGHCWLDNYNVRYAVTADLSKPFRELNNKPILETNKELQIFGPGHNSVIQIDGRWIMFYHRQDQHRYPTCNYRYACAAELTFSKDGQISKVTPIDDLSTLKSAHSNYQNIAAGAKVLASASLSEEYDASLVTDGRNDSRWQSLPEEDQWLTIDLGSVQDFNKVQVDFEYFDRFYLYEILYSTDGIDWKSYADYTQRAQKGYETRSTTKDASARYIKLHIKRAERGYASIWEVKVLKNLIKNTKK